jgi:protein-L-isoaspartate(D-aspartate) O-methyltransferase
MVHFKNLFSGHIDTMIATQIVSRGIQDTQLIEAFRKVPRNLFVPENRRDSAYDGPLPIGDGQTISQPYIVAFMTKALDLSLEDRVLEIGTGSGYQAAILAEIVREVFTIEIIAKLGKTAQERLKKMGCKNISVKIGDGYKGWPEKAPFNGIIVTCAPERIPKSLIDQLAKGGRMIIPVGEKRGIQKLVLIRKDKGMAIKKEVMDVLFVPMVKHEEFKD